MQIGHNKVWIVYLLDLQLSFRQVKLKNIHTQRPISLLNFVFLIFLFDFLTSLWVMHLLVCHSSISQMLTIQLLYSMEVELNYLGREFQTCLSQQVSYLTMLQIQQNQLLHFAFLLLHEQVLILILIHQINLQN